MQFGDWSSDVCSSDLIREMKANPEDSQQNKKANFFNYKKGVCPLWENQSDRKSVVQGKSVDLGGRRIIKKKKEKTKQKKR